MRGNDFQLLKAVVRDERLRRRAIVPVPVRRSLRGFGHLRQRSLIDPDVDGKERPSPEAAVDDKAPAVSSRERVRGGETEPGTGQAET